MRTYGMSGSLGSPRSKPGTMVVSGYEAGALPLSGMFCERPMKTADPLRISARLN